MYADALLFGLSPYSISPHIKQQTGDFFIYLRILVVLTRLLINELSLNISVKGTGNIPHLLQEVLFYIHENYCHEVSVNEISNHFKVSPQYIISLFNKSLRKSPLQYINKLRISRSNDLMCYSTMTVKEISYSIVLDNPHYFSMPFKKIEGVSLTEFKSGFDSKSNI